MRRSGRKFTAGLLAAIMVASSCFSGVTTVYAEETIVEESREVDSQNEESSQSQAEDSQNQESSQSQAEDSQNQESSQSQAEDSDNETKSTEQTTTADEEDSKQQTTVQTEESEEQTTEKTTEQSEEVEKEACAQVKASVAAGEVTKGTKVALSTETEGAVIMYNTNGSENYTTYKEEIEINEDTTIVAFAVMKDGSLEDSEKVSFSYTVKEEQEEQKTASEGVFFSEYVEGSSNNKALEIYNGTGSDIDLSEYKVSLYDNGKTEAKNNYTFKEGTTLAAGDVFVLANSGSVEDLLEIADATSSVCNFNGDDAIVLFHNDTMIDVLGTIGEKKVWTDGDKSFKDCTLVRNDAATSSAPTFSFDEWTGHEVDTFKYLGVRSGVGSDVIAIDEAKKAEVGTTDLTVKGIVTFVDGRNVYLQDKTAGIVAFYDAAPTDIEAGDTLTVKGTRAIYNGLEELTAAETAKIKKATSSTVLPSTEVTIQELLEDYAADSKYESTRVLIKDVEIGKINTSGNTTLTDADGNSVNVYKIPALTDVKEGDQVSVYAVVGDYNGIQLRVASADDVTVNKTTEDDKETLYDPISDELIASIEGAVSVKDAATLAKDTTATVVGQVVYAYASKAGDNLINIVLEDVIDNEIYGYLVYDYKNYSQYKAGDIVAVEGTATVYNGVPELTNVTKLDILENVEAIEAQEVTTAQLGADYMSEYVCIKDATLGAYNATGSTTITDAAGNAAIFKAAAYPEGVVAGDVVDVYAACSAYNKNYQLRNGVSSDYRTGKSGSYEIDDSITLNMASFAGSANFDGNTVYGDLYDENDYLDKDTKLTLSNGNQPLLSNTSSQTGGTTYSIGSKGLAADEYYQIETSSAQYGNLELSFFMKGSNTGAKNFVLEYSTDGKNFSKAGKGTLETTVYSKGESGNSTATVFSKELKDGTFSLQTASKMHEIHILLPEGANNAEKLTLRLRVTDSTSINGKEIGTGGTNYFNDIKITANPLVSDDFCGYVTVDPEAGEAGVGTQITMKTSTKDATIHYAFNGDSEYKEYNEDSKPVISELPCTVRVYASKDGIKDSIVVNYKYTQAKVATVKATPNGGAVAAGSKVKLTCETQDAQILYSFVKEEAKDTEQTTESEETNTDEKEETTDTYNWEKYETPVSLIKLPCTMVVKAVKEGYEDSAVKTLTFTARENEKYNIYFGQLHAHTSYSDGAGTCEEAFQYASKVDNLDFLAVTDHSNSFDNADQANINDGSMSTEWVEGHELAQKYTTDDFVGIFGYEMTWSNGLGHMNTFNTDGFQSRTQSAYATYSTALQNYYATLQTAPDSINQFNHPGTTFGDFSDFAYYSESNDALITTIEVGNGEGAIGSSGYFPSYEYYTRALDKGWHVAPTNNQDNHKGKWGSANTARSVVLADSLTQDNIYDAMRNYRVYATEDNDLSIYYTLDSYIMGTILDKDMVGDTVELNVELSDPTDTKLGKVEVIVNGGLSIASKTVDTAEAAVNFEVPSSYSYYYIKVTEADGDIAVTAPVWVGEVEAAGINALSTDEALPIAGEPLDVTLDLYNNEKTALNIESIEFTVDDKTVKAVDLDKEGLTKVASEGTATYTFSYTHDKVGAMEMNVVVKASLNGVEKVYNDVLKLTYVDNSMVSHVVIDGTHYNDYVTGYYGDNVDSFISIAADKNVKAKVVKDEITAETLKDAAILVVSAPAKKTGTANAGDYKVSHYEDSFLETVKEYVENGGTVIVCGLADYQDTTSGQTATETNKLLEAIGATIRMNSDEAYDEVNNGGQAYRLYYKNVNTSSPYLKGFKEGQTYSAYSGCTVDITNATEETDSVYPAQWLVKGFDTTYSIDCKTDSGEKADSSVYVEKGNVVALASQKTKFGGEIFVGGSVFMSNFEVKAELDNNDSLPYANYTIINNILDAKKVEIEATDIAKVRKAEMGDVFAIEGYVANGTANENTTFFDTIYVQDATGSITVFPFATAGVKNGTKIRVVGYVDAYQGDKELQLVSYEILDDKNLATIKPTHMSVVDSMDYDKNGGKLIEVTGKVSAVEKDGEAVSEFWLTDDNGNEAAIFIDGYITSGTTGKNTLASIVEKGKTVTAVGFLYKHPEGDSDVSVPVLRVRDCDEITAGKPESSTEQPSTEESGETNSSTEESTSDNSTTTASTTTSTRLTTIAQELAPLADSVTDAGLPYVDVALGKSARKLRTELLQKYYGRNLYLMAHLGNGVGFSIYAPDIQDVMTEYDFDSELMQLPEKDGFKVFYMRPVKAIKLPYSAGIHMNLGTEYVGKTAYIYSKSLLTGNYELVNVTIINEIGNVAIQTNELTDIIVQIAQ